jgi:NADPH:quinone reductase-like Zn-dependent oxidoreductase
MDPATEGVQLDRVLRTSMKAVRYDRYGSPDVLRLEEIERPMVGDDEVEIRVRAASVNPYEWHFMRGEPFPMRARAGWARPKDTRLGVDLAGVVTAVGGSVRDFKPGDEVFGAGKGAYAEYGIAPERHLALKPTNVSFEQAAAVPIAAFTAIQGLRDCGRIQSGQKVLINGAAGGVGTYAVQLAKYWGAEVTGVCSTRNVEMVGLIGADQVIDYTKDDFTHSADRYDLIFDMIGNHSLSKCRRVLASDGTFVMIGGRAGRWFRPIDRVLLVSLVSRFASQTLVTCSALWSKDDLLLMQQLMETGQVMSVIDRTYPLNQVPEAIRYVEAGHARGKVVITI